MKWNWIHEYHKAKMKVLGKSFHSLSFNFQKVSNFTHFQSINQPFNQTNKHKYLFNITFQILEYCDVTNLPHLKWISSSRFEKARKKSLGFGGHPRNPPIITEVRGATTLKSKAMVPTKFMYSILWVDGVGLLISSW